jgi:hypothetical protein
VAGLRHAFVIFGLIIFRGRDDSDGCVTEPWLRPSPSGHEEARLQGVGLRGTTVANLTEARSCPSGPDNKGLAATAIAGGEDAGDVGHVLLVLGLDVGAGVAI